MHQGEVAYRLVKALCLALFVEKGILMVFGHQIIELEVAAMHLFANERPFAENDRLAIGSGIGQGIALHDVALQQVADVYSEFVAVIDHRNDSVEQPLAALLGIVGQQLDAIDAADGLKGVLLEFGGAVGVTRGYGGHLATQDFDKEIAVATGWFEETAVDAFRLVLHQIEHRVHLTRVGEHLTMVSHPLP